MRPLLAGADVIGLSSLSSTGSAGPEPLQHDRGSARGSVEPGPWERWDFPLGLVFLSGVVSFKNCRKVFKISKYHPSFP